MAEFDVFLCHNSQDKPEVIKIAQELQKRELKPWLDEWHLQPGLPWQRELERQITNIRAAAVFIGKSGFGPWQRMEIEAYLRRFVNQGSPVIPVLLDNAPKQPELPIFLEGMTWVDFRHSESNPMNRLIWGITGIRPADFGTRLKAQAQSFTSDLGNGVNLEMIAIPGGTFMMGSPEGEGYDDEKPQHKVTVPSFFLGKYPITQAQYQQVMGENPSNFKGDDRPVELVSWDDAEEFCQ
ncbi:MAG: TIR domain-containing protein, partial [Waterburya sp.]